MRKGERRKESQGSDISKKMGGRNHRFARFTDGRGIRSVSKGNTCPSRLKPCNNTGHAAVGLMPAIQGLPVSWNPTEQNIDRYAAVGNLAKSCLRPKANPVVISSECEGTDYCNSSSPNDSTGMERLNTDRNQYRVRGIAASLCRGDYVWAVLSNTWRVSFQTDESHDFHQATMISVEKSQERTEDGRVQIRVC